MNTTLAGSTLASQAQAQLSFLQYRASQVMQPDNSDVEHDLPQVGQNVCSALYLFLFFAGVAIRSRSGKGLAEGEGFEPSTPVTVWPHSKRHRPLAQPSTQSRLC
jgi:hypothetical protein